MNGLPNLSEERRLWKKGFIVIGIDEVGRGAFAGPLCVGGVTFSPTTNYERITKLLSYGINDSKKLKPSARKMLSKIIQKESLAYYVSTISVPKINRVGISKATFMGMRDVVKNLRETLRLASTRLSASANARSGHAPDSSKVFILIDKFYVKYLKGVGLKNQWGIIHGDQISLSIAAASIIAKVHRDNQMGRLSDKYPAFKLRRNKGYGTLFHRQALGEFGKTKIHRIQFVKKFI